MQCDREEYDLILVEDFSRRGEAGAE